MKDRDKKKIADALFAAEGDKAKTKELIESGLGVPQITRFVRLLREEGIDLPENIYTVEEALREVKRLLGERRGDNA